MTIIGVAVIGVVNLARPAVGAAGRKPKEYPHADDWAAALARIRVLVIDRRLARRRLVSATSRPGLPPTTALPVRMTVLFPPTGLSLAWCPQVRVVDPTVGQN